MVIWILDWLLSTVETLREQAQSFGAYLQAQVETHLPTQTLSTLALVLPKVLVDQGADFVGWLRAAMEPESEGGSEVVANEWLAIGQAFIERVTGWLRTIAGRLDESAGQAITDVFLGDAAATAAPATRV